MLRQIYSKPEKYIMQKNHYEYLGNNAICMDSYIVVHIYFVKLNVNFSIFF